ncbi:hypothetical protein KIN20_029780 [Parelaphostrongylus tenuis]|uniref:Uncharacterized protein n=1 Tax=Parelaphostrongylus tenuis TaxID=148309 RepID=A0AAD5R327_PARTN|nr:hypothetical protein KIN20_029780 [Parelaphostrongylus tenuis]
MGTSLLKQRALSKNKCRVLNLQHIVDSAQLLAVEFALMARPSGTSSKNKTAQNFHQAYQNLKHNFVHRLRLKSEEVHPTSEEYAKI